MESSSRCHMSAHLSPKLPEGLDLEVSSHPITMKRVANLIIAMQRLKDSRSESLLATEMSDENLLNVFLEDVVEERYIFELCSSPSEEYSRKGEHPCSINDSEKRSLVLVENSMELISIMLQGGSEDRKVHLNMSTYVNPSPSKDAQIVALGIRGTNLYLSCQKEGEEPTLHLEPVDDRDSLAFISNQSDLLRFLFYKHDSGKSLSTLMSACYPDWYISTAIRENQPVEMCQQASNRYRIFTIQRQS